MERITPTYKIFNEEDFKNWRYLCLSLIRLLIKEGKNKEEVEEVIKKGIQGRKDMERINEETKKEYTEYLKQKYEQISKG